MSDFSREEFQRIKDELGLSPVTLSVLIDTIDTAEADMKVWEKRLKVIDKLVGDEIKEVKNEFSTLAKKYKDALIGISDYLQEVECQCITVDNIHGGIESKIQCMKCDILEFIDDAI